MTEMTSAATANKAEHKAVQLSVAHKLGFNIPRIVITNNAKGILQVAKGDRTIAVKGLDTVLVWQDGFETFGYTSWSRPVKWCKSSSS